MKKTKLLLYGVTEGKAMIPIEKIISAPTIEDLFVKFEVLNYQMRKTNGASFYEFMKPETEKKQIAWWNELSDDVRMNLYQKGIWKGKKLKVDTDD